MLRRIDSVALSALVRLDDEALHALSAPLDVRDATAAASASLCSSSSSDSDARAAQLMRRG